MAAPRRHLAASLLLAAAALAPGCATPAHAPRPIALPPVPPEDLFARCAEVLVQRFGRLPVADPGTFRLQTDWHAVTVGTQAVQRRALLFRDGEGLGLLVEARYLRGGWLGGQPSWTEPRPDPDAEREVAEVLAAAIGS